MDAQLKQKWVEALRSGEITQARDELKTCKGAMCCLAVLGHVAGLAFDNDKDGSSSQFHDGSEYDEHYGMDYPALGPLGITNADETTLINMNDKRLCNFDEIASYIEANIPSDAGAA